MPLWLLSNAQQGYQGNLCKTRLPGRHAFAGVVTRLYVLSVDELFPNKGLSGADNNRIIESTQ